MYAIFVSEMTLDTKMRTFFFNFEDQNRKRKKVGTKMKIGKKCWDKNCIFANMLYNKHPNGF